MTGNARHIKAPVVGHVLHGEVERGSDGEVAQKDENMDETNYSDMEDEEPDEKSDEGSDYGTSRSSFIAICKN